MAFVFAKSACVQYFPAFPPILGSPWGGVQMGRAETWKIRQPLHDLHVRCRRENLQFGRNGTVRPVPEAVRLG
ncbi:hypothetical protein DM02DRAFT_610171 [Periconia macrospinosa]|uniref:Uncharacterized protein n=1 Tax=Periconia macrospinosa TaxID=97972 RepID=A0A2V1EAF6_9PLEO|nr:hypothetical protein DM02DRAFT_610171 [Periconia macrospinosa]